MMTDEVTELIDEVRRTFHLLAAVAERLHADLGVTASQRAVLEHLGLAGPATVPAVARDRGVSRQHVQTIVNDLLARGLVTLAPNPAHRRSPLVGLTAEGETTLVTVRDRERTILAGVDDPGPAEATAAAAALRGLRGHLAPLALTDHTEVPT